MILLTSTIEATLLGFVVAVGMLFLLNANDYDDHSYSKGPYKAIVEIKQNSSDPGVPGHSEILHANVPSAHVPSGICVEVSRQLLVLFVICFEQDKIPRLDNDVLPPSHTLLLTLFRTQISPNAP
jgi:hypothetical protein